MTVHTVPFVSAAYYTNELRRSSDDALVQYGEHYLAQADAIVAAFLVETGPNIPEELRLAVENLWSNLHAAYGPDRFTPTSTVTHNNDGVVISFLERINTDPGSPKTHADFTVLQDMTALGAECVGIVCGRLGAIDEFPTTFPTEAYIWVSPDLRRQGLAGALLALTTKDPRVQLSPLVPVDRSDSAVDQLMTRYAAPPAIST